jgi:opacity protein-like surface antigen
MALRRSLFAAALAAVVALPATAFAQRTSKTTTTAGSPALTFGGGIGFEFDDATGIGLRVDGVYPLKNLTPEITMGVVGSLGFTHFGDEVLGVDVSTNIFKAVPAVRFGYGVNPQLSLYGDAGLGLYYANTSVDIDVPDNSESDVGVVMRLAAGGLYAISPQLQLGVELGLKPYFGDLDANTFSLFGVVVYKM